MTEGLHPRPQFTRPRWTDLCGSWQFAYDDTDVGRAERWPERTDAFPLRITVPYPPESALSGIGDRSFHPVVWYRRTFDRPDLADGERLLLHFGAVDYRAEVWVNGRFVVRHEGGHTPFEADVTEVLLAEAEQVVVVRAEDLPTDLGQPRGKQDFQEQPHNVWYQRTTGIWQPVWLEPVPARRIHSARWNTDYELGAIRARIALEAVPAGSAVRIRVTREGGELVAADTYTVTETDSQQGLTRDVFLPRARMGLDWEKWLWSPENPNLLDVTLTLLGEDGRPLDEVASYVGFRSVGISGGRFLLNNRPYHLRLVLAQGYWPESHLAAPSADALRREVELIRELGFNGVRLHQKVEDPRFLYWCDRLGVAVWAELPAAYAWSPTAATRTTREFLEVLERDVSSPSVVAWVPVNESWGVPSLRDSPEQRAFVSALYSLAKALDGTRPVVGNDGWEHVVTDLITVHDYAGDGATLRERYGDSAAVERALQEVQPYYRPVLLRDFRRGEEPILLSEFGGISYRAGDDFWNGYGTADSEEDFVRRYRDLLDAVLDSHVLAGFCYTQLTDTEQERNGLLDADRQPKANPTTLRSITRRPSAAVPGDAIYHHQLGGTDA
jgi:beta-galactosidase/beta-glucuronidase